MENPLKKKIKNSHMFEMEGNLNYLFKDENKEDEKKKQDKEEKREKNENREEQGEQEMPPGDDFGSEPGEQGEQGEQQEQEMPAGDDFGDVDDEQEDKEEKKRNKEEKKEKKEAIEEVEKKKGIQNEEDEDKPLAEPSTKTSEDTHGGDEATNSIENSPNMSENGEEGGNMMENQGEGEGDQEMPPGGASEGRDGGQEGEGAGQGQGKGQGQGNYGKKSKNGNSGKSEENSKSESEQENEEENESKQESETKSNNDNENNSSTQKQNNDNDNTNNNDDDEDENENNNIKPQDNMSEKEIEDTEEDDMDIDIEITSDKSPGEGGYARASIAQIKTDRKTGNLATRFSTFINKFAKQPNYLHQSGKEDIDIRRAIRRSITKEPVETVYVGNKRNRVILFLDDSGSMTQYSDLLSDLATIAKRRGDVLVLKAPNGVPYLPSEVIKNPSKRARVLEELSKVGINIPPNVIKEMAKKTNYNNNIDIADIIKGLAKNQKIIFVGDFDGNDFPIELSQNNQVVWLAPVLQENIDGYHTDYDLYRDFKGMFVRLLTEKELARAIDELARIGYQPKKFLNFIENYDELLEKEYEEDYDEYEEEQYEDN